MDSEDTSEVEAQQPIAEIKNIPEKFDKEEFGKFNRR